MIYYESCDGTLSSNLEHMFTKINVYDVIAVLTSKIFYDLKRKVPGG